MEAGGAALRARERQARGHASSAAGRPDGARCGDLAHPTPKISAGTPFRPSAVRSGWPRPPNMGGHVGPAVNGRSLEEVRPRARDAIFFRGERRESRIISSLAPSSARALPGPTPFFSLPRATNACTSSPSASLPRARCPPAARQTSEHRLSLPPKTKSTPNRATNHELRPGLRAPALLPRVHPSPVRPGTSMGSRCP
jgi:hypothetical protein